MSDSQTLSYVDNGQIKWAARTPAGIVRISRHDAVDSFAARGMSPQQIRIALGALVQNPQPAEKVFGPPPRPKASPNRLKEFIATKCHSVPGAMILFSEFFDRFQGWLDEDERLQWGKQKVVTRLPGAFVYGSYGANRRYVGNISWDNKSTRKHPLSVKDGKLIK